MGVFNSSPLSTLLTMFKLILTIFLAFGANAQYEGYAPPSYGYGYAPRAAYGGYAPLSYGYVPRAAYGGYAPPSYGYSYAPRAAYGGYAPPSYGYAPARTAYEIWL